MFSLEGQGLGGCKQRKCAPIPVNGAVYLLAHEVHVEARKPCPVHHSMNTHSCVSKTSCTRSLNNKNRKWKAPRAQMKKEFKLRKVSYPKNHYSRILSAISRAGFFKLHMSAAAQPFSPLLINLQGGQLTVPAGPNVPKCTCSHGHFWLCSS